MRRFRTLVAAVVVATVTPLQAAELPAGAALNVRLTSHLSSRTNRPGDLVESVLVAPVRQAGDVLLSPMVQVLGHVVEVRGNLGRRARLRVQFDRILTGGASIEIAAHVAEVDNARETIGADGAIVGVATIASPPSRLHGLLLMAAYSYPVAFVALEAVRLLRRGAERPGIDYRPGVEMRVVLDRPVRLPAGEASTAPLPMEETLVRLAAEAPLRAKSTSEAPSDLTNVLVVGTESELRASFEAAGWTQALAIGTRTMAKGFWALVRKRGYDQAAVSRLELEGRQPDIVFEKQCNTLAKRHHVRFWRRPEDWNGRAVWLGAATHDVGITFSGRQLSFTHRIDPRIDLERTKIADDLAASGGVETAELVARPSAPRTFLTAAGSRTTTDGEIEVIVLRPRAANPATVASR